MSPPKVMTYAGLKRGMRVEVYGHLGTIVDKDNAKKVVLVRVDANASASPLIAEAVDVLVLPSDPLDQIHPMLAKNAKDFAALTIPHLVASHEWAFEEKYDGERQILRYGGHRAFQATTRVVGKNTGRLGDNTGKLQHLGAPIGSGVTVLDVELFHTEGFQRLRAIMGSDDAKANARQAEWGHVYAIAFDCLWFAGQDLRQAPFRERRQALVEALSDSPQDLHVSPLASTPEEKELLLSEIAARGGEGAMVKRWSGLYTDTELPGRRSPDVLKIKPFDEADVIITGFVRGEGKYNQDMFGAITIAQWVPRELVTPEMTLLKEMSPNNPVFGFVKGHTLVSMGACSGFSNEQEAEFRANPDAFINTPIEIKYQQRWPETGLFRHPNFLRLRGDKAPEQCVYVPRGS